MSFESAVFVRKE